MSEQRRPELEIAVVGMACRLPGAASVSEFWLNLRAGVESIRDLPEKELRAAGLDEAALRDPRLVRRGADLQAADHFDAPLFGFTPREAELMDPQFRVFLEDVRTALEDAGYLSESGDLRVGLFAGAGAATYLLNNVYANPRAAEALGAFQTSIGNERDYLATHVSYRLDLRGPSVVVQSACSTSLVAVHLACQSLLNHECDVAVAGGVSISFPQTAGYLHEEGGIVSRDGRCRAFDEAADGCVKGNGSGVVVLRRLEDSLRDGDAIRAVILGSAVNNDGALKVGFTAPSPEGQAGVIAEALAAAGVDPAGITYVETHGTATALGDPVEIAALARAFGPRPPGAPRCAIGSVKTNVGHLDAAAGVVGLIKTVLALRHREIPPSLHFSRPNPKLELEATPFYVNAELRAWDAGGGPRRAGVSSFGIGGTNAHVILEEAPAARPSARGRPARLLVLSAATRSALDAASSALAARLESADAPPLADAAFTLQTGRRRMTWRRSLVARDAAEAIAALRDGDPRDVRRDERRGAQTAFLFPGQGAQHAGMALELYRGEPLFRDVVDRCAGILAPALGLDPRELIFAEGPSREEADRRLMETTLAQPSLFAVEYALARLWISWGIRPAAMAGHSIGEYVAACLADVMTLEDALALVAERGRLMGTPPRGAMLAVQLGESELTARLEGHPGLALAAVNGPASGVVSGPPEGIERLARQLDASGIPHRPLRTSHAFHSAMMDPIVGPFRERLRRVRLSPPSIPFLSNLTGTWISPEQATDPGYWADHLRRTVRFADNLAALVSDPSRVLLEVGPGTTLASLARLQAGPDAAIVASLPHPKEAADAQVSLLRAVGRLWCAGADVDWTAFHADAPRSRTPLPCYPYERKRHWIEPVAGGGGWPSGDQEPERENQQKNPDRAAWFYVPGWKRALCLPTLPAAEPDWLLLDDGSETARAVADLALARGARVTRVRPGGSFSEESDGGFRIDPRRPEDHLELLRALRSRSSSPSRVVHMWCAGGDRLDPEAAQDLGFFTLLHLMQAFGHAGVPADLRVAAVAGDLFDVTGGEAIAAERATMIGVCRVAPMEYAGVSCRLVDPGGAAPGESARRILAELDTPGREAVAAWRGEHRWVPSFERIRLDAPAADPDPIRSGGACVITGGTGLLELALARRLREAGVSGVLFLECEADAEAAVAPLRAAGLKVVCAGARVADAAGTAAALDRARETFGRLDAVFHTAGSIGGGMIQLKDRESARRVLAPRLEGTRALAERLGAGETLVLFSSAISITGVFGQSDYCAASAYLDALAEARARRNGPRVVSIDWGTAHWDRWQGASGPGSEALVEQLREIQRSVGITVEEGIDALWRALAPGLPRVVVSTQDLDDLTAQAAASTVAEFLENVSPSVTAAAAAGDEREITPPATDTERRVAGVWTALLGIARIGRTDNFFDLGGNSLLAIQLASQLRRTFEVDLTIATLFESADLAGLAAAVDAAAAEKREAEEVARLLAEIEALSDDEVRSELSRDAGPAGLGASR